MDKELLAKVVAATDGAPGFMYLTAAEGGPLLNHTPPLIEKNDTVTEGDKVACRALPAAKDYLAANQSVTAEAVKTAGNYAIMTGIKLPELKRRGNTSGSGAPTKYPFADLPVGGVFFSGNSEHNKGDAVKALGSTVSAQNDKNAVQKQENGQPVFKTVTRAVRDKATKKAQIGPDGKKVMETVELPVKEYTKKFTIRPVQKGYTSGTWTAPEDGALVARTV